MSGEAMAWALDQDLPAEEKFLLVMISDSGGSDPSRQFTTNWAAMRCGLERHRIAEILGSLQTLRLIGIRHLAGDPDECHDVWLHHDRYVTDRQKFSSQLRAEPQCFVYIARAAHGGCKVGISTDVVQRRRTLEHGAGCAIELIWHQQMATNAARSMERAILNKFAGQRRFGEWVEGVDPDEVVRAALERRGGT